MVRCEAEQPLVANYLVQVVLARPAGSRSLARKREIFGKKTFVIKNPKRGNKGKFVEFATRGAGLVVARVRVGAP